MNVVTYDAKEKALLARAKELYESWKDSYNPGLCHADWREEHDLPRGTRYPFSINHCSTHITLFPHIIEELERYVCSVETHEYSGALYGDIVSLKGWLERELVDVQLPRDKELNMWVLNDEEDERIEKYHRLKSSGGGLYAVDSLRCVHGTRIKVVRKDDGYAFALLNHLNEVIVWSEDPFKWEIVRPGTGMHKAYGVLRAITLPSCDCD